MEILKANVQKILKHDFRKILPGNYPAFRK